MQFRSRGKGSERKVYPLASRQIKLGSLQKRLNYESIPSRPKQLTTEEQARILEELAKRMGVRVKKVDKGDNYAEITTEEGDRIYFQAIRAPYNRVHDRVTARIKLYFKGHPEDNVTITGEGLQPKGGTLI
jgi:hypothetical protein